MFLVYYYIRARTFVLSLIFNMTNTVTNVKDVKVYKKRPLSVYLRYNILKMLYRLISIFDMKVELAEIVTHSRKFIMDSSEFDRRVSLLDIIIKMDQNITYKELPTGYTILKCELIENDKHIPITQLLPYYSSAMSIVTIDHIMKFNGISENCDKIYIKVIQKGKMYEKYIDLSNKLCLIDLYTLSF